MLGVWVLCVPLGQSVGLGILALAFALWGLVPHAKPGGLPLPPAMVPAAPDPGTERIRLASKVCGWAGLFGHVPALLWARVPLEMEVATRQRALHPEWPRPRYWLRFLVFVLVMTGLLIWGLAFLVSLVPPTP